MSDIRQGGDAFEKHFKIKDDLGHKRKDSVSTRSECDSVPHSIKASSVSSEDSPKYRCKHRECCFAYNLSGNLRNASFIAESLPLSTYEKLSAFWNLDPQKVNHLGTNSCKKLNPEENTKREGRANAEIDDRSSISWDLQVCTESLKREKSRKHLTEKQRLGVNSAVKLSKPEDKKTNAISLGKRAGRITKMIIQNFMEWYQSLGGNDGETFIEESMLESLFQIGFDLPESKALEIRIMEKPTVPDCLTNLKKLPRHSTRYGLKQFLKQDMILEETPVKMFAFGTMLPKEKPSLRFKPPQNQVRKTWMECSRVPSDLESMKTVWGGLEKLRSTIAFSNWLKQHDNIKPPAYLENTGIMNINYEKWCQMYTGFEVEAESIEGNVNVVIQPKASLTVSKDGSKTVSSNMDSTDSF